MEPSPNRSSRRRPPFWTRRGSATRAELDAVLSKIESATRASDYRKLNLRALRSSGRHDQLVEAISGCDLKDRCTEILCSRCARRYRLWFASELLHLVAHGPPAFVATILLDAVRGPALKRIDLRVLHERVRKRLTRAGVRAAIGGTEARYDVDDDRWTVHLHLLVFGSLERARPRLRRAFRDATLKKPVVCQPLRNRVAQISYLQKFLTCHRPGLPGFCGRARAYPMKAEQVVQLARWTERYRFEDFLFILGLRRRGSRVVPERGFKQALLEHRRKAEEPWRRGDAAAEGLPD